LDAEERRDNLVTPSALVDPGNAGAQSHRELSGFLFTADLKRRALSTLSKSLLPLLLMTLIMFASLYFPVALVKEKITVAITAALLAAVNSQLGGIGYTIAVEYAFYLFFALSLLCIVSVLMAERSRHAKRGATAVVIERWTRVAFLLVVAITMAGGVGLAYQSG
jgi:branched-chain amino acid transport system substrate-binding protein